MVNSLSFATPTVVYLYGHWSHIKYVQVLNYVQVLEKDCSNSSTVRICKFQVKLLLILQYYSNSYD